MSVYSYTKQFAMSPVTMKIFYFKFCKNAITFTNLKPF